MKLREAVRHYGTKYKVAKALGIHRSCLTRWKDGNVPVGRAIQLEDLTKGALKFNKHEYTVR